MAEQVWFADPETRNDVRTYAERLSRVGGDEMRLLSHGKLLLAYGCTQAPRGLIDAIPVVLVMRTFELAQAPERPVDVTVQTRALLDRLARNTSGGAVEDGFDLPDVTTMVAWAGVLPPQSGWQVTGMMDAASVAAVAADGIARVAAALPQDPGDAVVQQVRSAVWGSPMGGGFPAAAAFAAEALGFLRGTELLRLATAGSWSRMSAPAGHVLVRAPFLDASFLTANSVN